MPHLDSGDEVVQNVYDDLPDKYFIFKGTCILVSDPKNCKTICTFLLNSGGVLGFDVEWWPSFATGVPWGKVALCQLYCPEKDTVYLFPLLKLAVKNKTTSQSELPASLVNLLQNQHTFKAGINIKNDCTLLQQDYSIIVGGQLDVGDEVTL